MKLLKSACAAGLSAIGLFLILLLFSVSGKPNDSPVVVGCAGLAALATLVFIILAGQRTRVRFVVSVVILGAALLTYTTHYYRLQRMVDRYREAWVGNGWPVRPDQVFSAPPTPGECQEWLELCTGLDDGESRYLGQFGPFFRDIEKHLGTGQGIKSLLLHNPLRTDRRWPWMHEFNLAAARAARTCSNLVILDPEEVGGNLAGVSFPSLYGFYRLARSTSVDAMTLAAVGRIGEARQLCFDLVSQSRALQDRAPILIQSLVGTAMERKAAVAFVGIQAMAGVPLDPAARQRLQSVAGHDISCIRSAFEGERLFALDGCAHPIRECVSEVSVMAQLGMWNDIPQTALGCDCENLLLSHTIIGEVLSELPDFSRDEFAWQETRLAFLHSPGDGDLWLNPENIYFRAVSLKAQWRLALAVDQVLGSYATTGRLPPSVSELADERWPEDPFDEQPMRYRRDCDDVFTVYSVGADEIDSGGEHLYVSGAIDKFDGIDVGFRIRLSATGPGASQKKNAGTQEEPGQVAALMLKTPEGERTYRFVAGGGVDDYSGDGGGWKARPEAGGW